MNLFSLKDNEILEPLDATVVKPSDGSENIIDKIHNGELIIWRQCLQDLHAYDHILEIFYLIIASLHDEECSLQIKNKGIHAIHEHLDNLAIEQVYIAMRMMLANKMPVFTIELFRKLGLSTEFNVHDASLLRIMTPHKNMQTHQREMDKHLGKLSLHGPHHDHYQNVPLNAINTWIAVGPVRKDNGMFMYTEHWGKNLPQGEGIVQMDQYLGKPVSVELEPGDALIFHSNHLHSSKVNATDETRVVLTNRICTGIPQYPNPAQPQNYYSSTNFSDNNDLKTIFNMNFSLDKANPSNVPDITTLSPVLPENHMQAEKNIPASSDSQLINIFTNIDDVKQNLSEGQVGALGKSKCVVNKGGEFLIFNRSCPHHGADMAGGFVDGEDLVCPFHGVKFSLKNGRSNCAGINKLKKGKSI